MKVRLKPTANQREQAADGETAQRGLEHGALDDRAAGRVGTGRRSAVLATVRDQCFLPQSCLPL